MSLIKSKPSILILSFLLALGLSLSLESLLAAWAPPNNYPPLDNVPAPITAGTSGSNQVINGDLGVTGNFMVGLQEFQEIGVTGVGFGLLLQNQDNGKNSRTWLGIAPSGTAQFADFAIFHNSDLTNYEKMQLGYDGSTNLFYVSTSKSGTGILRPLVFDATGVGSNQYKQLYLKTDGNVGIGTTDPLRQLYMYKSSGESILAIDAPTNKAVEFREGTNIKGYVGWERTTDQIRLINGNNLKDSTTGIFIDTNGDVGIGTQSTNAKLEISSGSGYDTGQFVRYTHAEPAKYYGYTALVTPAGAPKLILGTYNNGSSFDTLTLTQGNVGIGASNPGTKLYVKSDVSAGEIIEHTYSQTHLHQNTLWLKSNNAGNNRASIGFTVVNAAGDHHRANIAATGNTSDAGGQLSIYTRRGSDGADMLGYYQDETGNIGVGTTDLGTGGLLRKLTVDTSGKTGTNYMALFRGNSTDENVFWLGSSLESNNAFGINWDFTGNYSTANRACMGIWGDDLGGAGGCTGLAIADGGKIGIGTNNPQTLSDSGPMLHVAGLDNSHGGEVMVSSSDNSQFIALFSGLQGSPTAKPTVAYSSNQPLLFGTWSNINGNTWSEKMRIDTSGNVGIGTTDPGTNKLEVAGGPIKATGGLIIETRTAAQGDPASPVTGQMWLVE